MIRDEFVKAARECIGTRFHHQGRLPGVGLDCAGLVVAAAKACNYHVIDAYGYAPIPSHNTFIETVEKNCDKIKLSEIQPGDLAVFAFESEPQHIAIITGVQPITLCHAYLQVRKVVENHMDGTWLGRLRGCYRLRGIE